METNTQSLGVSIRRNRKFQVFLLCLIVTSVIWLLIELSQEYTSDARFKATYSNIPEQVLLENELLSEVEVTFKATGFNIIKYRLSPHEINFNLNNLTISSKGSYILTNNELSRLNTQFRGRAELTAILPDTIFVSLGRRKIKRVPLKSNITINFKQGYNFIQPLELDPDSVLISGPENQVDKIDQIETDKLVLNEVYEDIIGNITLKEPGDANNVEISRNEIEYFGEVDRFTEGSIKIPVVIINEPPGVKVNPYPKEIELTYQAGLSNFNRINEDSFSIVFDYNEYKNDSLVQFLTPVIQKQSDLVSSFKLSPRRIEFLIEYK